MVLSKAYRHCSIFFISQEHLNHISASMRLRISTEPSRSLHKVSVATLVMPGQNWDFIEAQRTTQISSAQFTSIFARVEWWPTAL
ncbi:hypothetical protein WJ33_28505 [Burkholderia ubonensis]|uniref:Uncharacterized protein n=1 Tax=Burkholderia ubonensis TaxID=101571 RepID=A0A103R9Z3_9BURK|nr:hypothetical protein WJ33_28505 [Burkholderia ubonensis]